MPAYLDHAASTPMLPEAIEAMLPFLTEHPANPSGAHAGARAARRAVDDARDDLADVLGVHPDEVVFTSGGTEADNLAVHAALAIGASGRAHCSSIEHPAVLVPVTVAGGTTLRVDRAGVVDLDALTAAIDPSASLVSVMALNNEVGTIQPIDQLAKLVRDTAPDAVVHTDAVQALTWLDLREVACHVDALSLSAHKFGGPKGVGALVWKRGRPLAPMIRGGGQERGRRSGTSNVAGIVAMAVAARLADSRRAEVVARVSALRRRLVDGLRERVPAFVETAAAAGAERVGAGHAHLCFEGIEAEALLFLLDEVGIAASAASSCASGAAEPSHVLAAMGVSRELAAGSLRLTLGWSSTDTDVDAVLAALPPAVEQLRARGS